MINLLKSFQHTPLFMADFIIILHVGFSYRVFSLNKEKKRHVTAKVTR